MQKDWPNGRQVHPHNGPVFSLPPFSGGRLTTREPRLNKTFAFRDVAKSCRLLGVGEGSPTGFHIEWKKGLLKFFIDGDTSQINFANGWLSQVSQSSRRRRRRQSLRLFGTWNVSPCLSSTVQIGLALGQIYETRRTNKIGAQRFFQFSMLAYDSRRGK